MKLCDYIRSYNHILYPKLWRNYVRINFRANFRIMGALLYDYRSIETKFCNKYYCIYVCFLVVKIRAL